MTKFLHTRNYLIDVQILDPEPEYNLCEAQGFRHRLNLLVLEMLFKQPEAFDAIVTSAVTRDGVCPSTKLWQIERPKDLSRSSAVSTTSLSLGGGS